MTEPYRLLITGSRDWSDGPTIWKALAEIARALPLERDLVMIHGACPTGADQMADEWGRGFGATIEDRPADWDHCIDACPQGHRKPKRPGDVVHPGVCADYCPSAGPRRNHEMVRLGADVCLAFLTPASRGGAQTARLAERAGIPVRRFTTP
ncbi:SLOG family protein [Streptomyces mirabilis]|uniref:SLOG family protein n=1 Tax=Streptomyces mirabilis TaxID=68239 RepID=UPI0036ACC70E